MEAFPGFHAMSGGGRLTVSVADLDPWSLFGRGVDTV
jgi:hypothetical protein